MVLETAVPAAIVDPRYMFNTVNEFYKSVGNQAPFKVQLAGLRKEVKLCDGMFSIHTDVLIKDIKKTDLIIIPAISGNINEALKANKNFIPWIIDQYNNGAEVASLCIGAFVLASTGLLKGKMCSTHWLFANEFRNMFPDIVLVDDKVITDQSGLYSSGGATSLWNLLLYLVEKYTNRETAILASKFFLLDISKNSQAPFTMFKGQKEHDDEIIIEVQDYIEKKCKNKITVDELSDKFGIGRRTFERRFKKATSNTVAEYIQRVKIEAAKKQLELSRKTIGEVMHAVGYSDTKAFRDVFKKITGMSPVDYKNKYSKSAVA